MTLPAARSTPSAPRASLRWRLPLLICAILATAIGVFAATAYYRMQGVLIETGASRATAAATQLASLLVQAGQQRLTTIARIAADPDLRAFARRPSPEFEAAARAKLPTLLGTQPTSVEVWAPDGRLLLSVDGRAGGSAKHAPASAPRQAPRGVQPMRVAGGTVVTETSAGIPAADPSEEAAVIVVRRAISGGAQAEAITQLVGQDAVIRIGSPGAVWTDLIRAADPPPLTSPGVSDEAASRRDGSVTAVAAVTGTPWLAAVSFPLDRVIAPARRLLVEGALLMLAVLAVAAIAVYKFTGRVTRPLADLSSAAEAIAAGDYARRVEVSRSDEIGRLGAAFNTMSAEVEDMHARLETRVTERTRELEAFSYSVSHDLRAPLRHIVGFGQLFEKHAEGRLDPESRRYLRTMMDAAGRMGRLIDDLLDFSRRGRAPLDKRAVPLRRLVDEARAEVSVDVEQRRIDWIVGDLPVVHGDPGLLRLVFVNLLSNAVKYTAPRETARIEVSANVEPTGDTVIAVRDNGVGFDPEYASKLFGVFQRLHRADEFAGTGIGLANVRQIVHRHGGRVWADAAAGKGATFYMSLPPEGAQPKEAA